jgi:hypothetical protein
MWKEIEFLLYTCIYILWITDEVGRHGNEVETLKWSDRRRSFDNCKNHWNKYNRKKSEMRSWMISATLFYFNFFCSSPLEILKVLHLICIKTECSLL